MCDLGIASLAVGIASAGMGMVQSYQQAKAQEDQAEYQAAVARNNQIIADRNAQETQRRGEEIDKQTEEKGRLEKNKYRRQVAEMQSDQMAKLAGQGVDVSTGTSIDLLADTAELGELDAQTIKQNTAQQAYDVRYQAARDAYNQRVGGMNQGAQAGLYQAQAEAQNPMMAGVSSLLSGAGSVASKWMTYKASGAGKA